ncbi:phage protein D [Bradyrhizobium sp. AZCC 1610]|uniref:phage late control D family protein n=1 Tax=Bradyrhizobium sp. AZCC 1610 TaxID=3117020 RepID=UPI002FF1C0C6
MAGGAVQQLGMPPGGGGDLNVDYYVPDFRIEVEGKQLSPSTHGDVIDLKVNLAADELGGFDVTLNNWDDEHLRFKYSDSAELMIGNMVRIELGYVNRTRQVIHGPITSVSPRFSENGALTVSISGKDSLEFLKARKPKSGETVKWVKKTDTEIAQDIARRNHLDFVGEKSPITHDVVYQKNLDDAQFLLQRARRIDFECFVLVGSKAGRNTLYFQPPRDGRDGKTARTYELEWGRSLRSFSPTLSSDRQVSKVTVRGWDPREKKAIVGVATDKDLPPSTKKDSTSGPELASKKFADRENLVVDRPVASEREARDLAVSILRERATRFGTGNGSTIGIPELQPDDNIDLKGVGDRFSGSYRVRKVTHSIGDGGYTTTFDVETMYSGS